MELAILSGLANGLYSKEIAQGLDRSTATVESYIRTLYIKLQARSRAQLVAKALCLGILHPEIIEIGAESLKRGFDKVFVLDIS